MSNLMRTCAVLWAASASFAALASDAAAPASPISPASTVAPLAPLAASPFGRPVSPGDLIRLRGGAVLQSSSEQSAVIENTRVENANTGRNTIAGGSLANAAGLPTLIQNTGNNVVIQNSTILNVRLN